MIRPVLFVTTGDSVVASIHQAPRELPPRLNLGCGRFPKEGFVNVDWASNEGVDVVHNLNEIPYPFEDETFELIEADHVIEHLSEVFSVMAELHRILKPGGSLVIRVPHFSRGFSHPEHKRGFDATFPYYFKPDFPGGYTGTPFLCENVTLRWFAQPYLKRSVLPRPLVEVGRAAGAIIDAMANLSPLVCSRIWCYWVGGFEEIEFRLKKPDA